MAVPRHSISENLTLASGSAFLTLAERDTNTPRLASYQCINPSGKTVIFFISSSTSPTIESPCWAMLEPIILILISQRWVTLLLVEPGVRSTP